MEKEAHPVYVFGGMVNGFSEYSQIMDIDAVQSVGQLKSDPKFKGFWTWSRGGGWRGPYISNELWCDINTISATIWAQNMSLTEDEVLMKTLRCIGVKRNSIKPFIRLLKMSDEAVLKGQCSNIDIKEARFNQWWTRDQFFSGVHELSEFMNYIIINDKIDVMLEEKSYASSLWREIERLADTIKMKETTDEEYLKISATYGRIKYELTEQIFIIALCSEHERIYGRYDGEMMKSAIERYDKLWQEWRSLKTMHENCPTLYEPNAFKITLEYGVQGDNDKGIASSVAKYRSL